MPARKPTFQIWYEHVKKDLLVTEPQNILARSNCHQNIINECLSHINSSLDLPELTAAQKYQCSVRPRDHLKFLMDWPGLRIDNSPKAPKTRKEYEKKSKNWLNGRRAPNYGKTLFPFFISDAEGYVLSTSKLLIPSNQQEKRRLYYDIVIYKILAQLCGCSVSLHEQAKKAPFFCKNSIERKGRLKEMLQSYASDHEYIQGFPSCFEEAIGYFDRKSNVFFHEYKRQYVVYNNGSMDDYDDDRFSVRSLRSDPQYMIKTVIAKPPKPPHPLKPEEKERNSMDVDAGYWKNQFMRLRRELSDERQIRVKVERERDSLKNLIHNSTVRAAANHNIGSIHALPLNNDNSYDSWNGSSGTVSTASSYVNLPSLQPSNTYSSPYTPSTHSRNNVHNISHHTNGFSMNHHSTQSAVHTMDTVHPYSSAISPGNAYALNHNGFAVSHPQSNAVSNALFPPSLSEMPSSDSFTANIMMNRQQRSNDSYSQYQIKSPVPLYSFQNVVANNETFGL